MSGASEDGVVFTCERLIVDNLVAAINADEGRGVAVKCDGTYKVGYEGGWNLFSLGTHAVKYNQRVGQVVHAYRPFVFAYVKSESNNTLRDLLMPSLLALVDGGDRLVSVTNPAQIWRACTATTVVVWASCCRQMPSSDSTVRSATIVPR